MSLRRSRRIAGLPGLLALAVLLGLSVPAVGADLNFVKVADTNTFIPNGSGITFSSLENPQISDGVVAFAGRGSDK